MIKPWRTSLVLAVGAISVLPACSNMFGADRSRSTSAATASTSQPVANGTVRQVQDKLKQQGYYKEGAVDGVWGAGTMSAVQAYQRAHNLGASGQLDVPTLKSLDVADINGTASNPPPTDTRPAMPDSTTPNNSNGAPATEPTDNTTNPR